MQGVLWPALLFTLLRAGVLFALGLTLGCNSEPESRGEKAPPTPSALRAPEASKEAPRKPWFEGAWTATTKLDVLGEPMDLDRAALREKADDEPPASGEPPRELSLTMSIDADRRVSGKAQVGSHAASLRGFLDGEVLRLRAVGDVLNGVIVAEKKGASLVGPAHLSVLEGSPDAPIQRPLRGVVELYPAAPPR